MQLLAGIIARHLPESPALFPADQVTDRSENFRISEIIREKLTLELNEELPYGNRRGSGGRGARKTARWSWPAVIWVDRTGQKAHRHRRAR